MRLGPVKKLGADAARKHAKKLAAQVVLGEDPAKAKAKERTERAKADVTLGGVIESYLDAKRASWRPKTVREVTYQLRTLWKPLHKLPSGEVARADVAARIRKIEQENGATTALRARGALSTVFSWAMREGIPIEQNPVAFTNAPKTPPPRERVLSKDELATLWSSCGEDDFGKIVRLLICTGCRRQEVGSMRWGELQDNRTMWVIPGSRTKNKREHRLPILGLAADIIASVPEVPGRDFLFGLGPNGYRGWDLSAKRMRGWAGPTADFTLHDVRRTVATMMAEDGIEPHHIEAVLNHQSGHKGGVHGIYNRATYQPAILAALAKWDSKLRSILGEKRKVLTFPAA